ncbi:hypothetical protein TrST_g9719 [Triparma strigata]|uniref:Bromodomain-containing protein n=1 Tax=Triparma strigata TaxID=1606541 RepID=A0A9W7DWT9_9STRA|nr:hypothetical protein TrST_g9719 [Triparma strigata]
MEKSVQTSLLKLLTQISSRSDASPFLHPVDWKALGLYDYPTIIKNPMDLTTVLKKLKSNQYSSCSSVESDVRLIWKNCMSYNADGSDFYLLASEFSKRFEEKISKLSKEPAVRSQVNPTNDTLPTAEQKQSFARNLFRIGKEELGRVVTVLDDKSPEALTKNVAEDEVEVNVDRILGRVFWELEEYVAGVLGKNEKKK